jgi:hypothetical protein
MEEALGPHRRWYVSNVRKTYRCLELRVRCVALPNPNPKPTQPSLLHKGHIVAKTKGGLITLDNLVPICGHCNKIQSVTLTLTLTLTLNPN